MDKELVEKCLLTNPECAQWLLGGENRDYLLRTQLTKAIPIIAEEIKKALEKCFFTSTEMDGTKIQHIYDDEWQAVLERYLR